MLTTATHVAELLVDFARLNVRLHVREADPLVQILAVVDLADGRLGVVSRQNLQHIWWDVILGLRLLIVLFVQALQDCLFINHCMFYMNTSERGEVSGGEGGHNLHPEPVFQL